jgi:thiamine-monophosphate kinase
MTAITLGTGGEFDRIRAIARALGDAVGPLGDDTAVIPEGPGTLVTSTDVSVEDVHFRRAWLRLPEIGWRATAAALSDLAAAAATPVGLSVALTVAPNAGEAELVEVMRGVGSMAQVAGTRVLGGDLSAGPGWAIAVTVFGRAGRPMSRRGGRPGDGVWVTGVLGGARAALASLEEGWPLASAARLAFARPYPRLAAGAWLAAHGATAMLDLSDGLGGDAGHLAAASGVGLRLELDRVPVHPAVAPVAARLGVPPEVFAAEGGEDYELLVTLPAGFAGAEPFEAATGVSLTRIGEVEAGATAQFLLNGRPADLRGYVHRI